MHKVKSKQIAIVILLDVILLLAAAAHLPNSSYSQAPTPQFPSASHNNITNSNNTIIHANNKSLSFQGTNSYSHSLNNNNKVLNIPKPKSSPSGSQTKIATTEVANVSQKGVDKFGIKEIYLTKKGGREWFINMADPRNDSIFSTGFSQNLIKQNSSNTSSNDGRGNNNINNNMVVVGVTLVAFGGLLIHRLECMLLLLQVLHNGKM